jgi:hypothetical protein
MPLPEPDERSLSREQLDQYLADAGLEGTPLAHELRSRGLFTPHVIARRAVRAPVAAPAVRRRHPHQQRDGMDRTRAPGGEALYVGCG